MNDVRVGRVVRSLRLRHGWRQLDLASRAGVSQQEVSFLERGHVAGASLRTVRSVLAALDASAEIEVRWRGGALDRLLDERHAQLVGETVRRLALFGWETATEVTYAVYGERGSIDVVARRAELSLVLVVEVKSELVSIEETLRKQDEKVRLAARIVRERLAWETRAVARMLVVPADRTTRRRIARAAEVLDRAYPVRGVAAREWLRRPSTSPVAILLLTDTNPSGGSRGVDRVATRRRECARARTPASTSKSGEWR